MKQVIHCDIAILGAGSGGLSLASGAAQLGAKVVLVESDKMGGDCLNYGCIPSKSLLAAAKSVYHTKHTNYVDIQTDALEVDFSKVMEHVRTVVATIGKHDSVERFESLGVQVIKASGKFIGPNVLQANDYFIHAKYFVIATGSSPFIPPIIGLDKIIYETNETIFNLNHLPAHLIVIGGGPIGCELAQAFLMLGSQVTLLEAATILPHDDKDCVAILREQFKRMGMVLHEKSEVQKVEQTDKEQITVHVKKGETCFSIQGSHLLVAAGRGANVKHLCLDKADVRYSHKGIEVDRRLRTTNKNIYAMGDVVGDFQFTHIASYHSSIILRNILFWLPAKIDYRAVPWITYTSPELAHVGITSKEAAMRSNTQITTFPFAGNDRAQAEHASDGLIKAVSDHKGRILGITIVGANAGELLLPWVIAIRTKKTLRFFTDTVVPYPTFSELSKQVAGEYYKPKLFSKWVRCFVRLLLKIR